MKTFGLHHLLDSGIPAIGTVLAFHSVDLMEAIATIGFDFVMIDCQNAPLGADSVLSLIRAAEAGGVAPLVRVATRAPEGILRVVDSGAVGIVVPSVDSKSDAQAAVAAVRYPPEGIRAYAPMVRSAGFGIDLNVDKYIKDTHKRTIVLPIVETRRGVLAASEILSIDGVTGLAFGAADLSMDLGLRGNVNAPEVSEARLLTLANCKAAGKPALAAAGNQDQARELINLGFSIILVPFTTWLIKTGREFLEDVKR